jgi:glycosyltransferase involved in cell wall biosynthesis
MDDQTGGDRTVSHRLHDAVEGHDNDIAHPAIVELEEQPCGREPSGDGDGPGPEVLALAGPRVEILSNVPSVVDVFQSADVAAFPDEHGVGIRNSVREALAAGLPVVATPVAAREQDPHPLLTVAPDTGSFVDHIVDRLTGPRPQGAARDAVAVRTWQVVTQEYLAELRSAIQSGSADLPLGSSPA